MWKFSIGKQMESVINPVLVTTVWLQCWQSCANVAGADLHPASYTLPGLQELGAPLNVQLYH